MNRSIAALSLVTLAASAGMAAADTSYLPIPTPYDGSSTVDFDFVRADGAGVVEIYTYNAGQQGDLIGSAPVVAGANDNLRVDVGIGTQLDLIAVLRVGGQIVDTTVLPNS
jgi:hypothetical protein